MKKLLWKELYEQRFIPLAYGALVAAVILACYGASVWMAHRDHRPDEIMSQETAVIILVFGMCILGLFPGCNAISPEVGSGTLNFLTVLPGGRARYWRAKVAAGLITVGISFIAVLVFYFVTSLCLFGNLGISSIAQGMDSFGVTMLMFAMALGYAVSLFFSTMVDRTITASVLGLAGGIGIVCLLGQLSSLMHSPGFADILPELLAFFAVAFLHASFVAFCKGGNLRTRHHVRIAVCALIGWCVFGGVGLAAYSQVKGVTAKDIVLLTQYAIHPQYPAELEKARLAGLPTTLAEISPKKLPPDNQNAAPLYLKIGDSQLYPVSKEENNAGAWTPAQRDAAKAFVVNHADMVALAHKAVAYPYCVISYGYSENDNPVTTTYPVLEGMRRAARIIKIESLVLVEKGRPLDAVHNEELCFRIGDQDENGVILYSYITDYMIVRSMQDILVLNAHNPAVCAAVNTSLAKHCELPHSIVPMLRNEFAVHCAEIDYVRRKGPQWLLQGNENVMHISSSSLFWNAYVDANATYLLRLDRELINMASIPNPDKVKKSTEILNRTVNKGSIQAWFAAMILPDAVDRQNFPIKVSTEANITRAAADVLAYKARHGVYPVALADAMPQVPLDPFDTKPLRYRREGTGFVVYSVGSTGKYDGGPIDTRKQSEEVFRWPHQN